MKAIRIHSYGNSGEPQLEEVPSPSIRSNEALVRVPCRPQPVPALVGEVVPLRSRSTPPTETVWTHQPPLSTLASRGYIAGSRFFAARSAILLALALAKLSSVTASAALCALVATWKAASYPSALLTSME